MKLKLIAAIGKNNELGNKNDLPFWNLQTDQKRFKDLTSGSTVVMGRKTYLSFPEKYRPLPNRRNVILTRDPNFKIDGAESFGSLEEFLESSNPEQNPPNLLYKEEYSATNAKDADKSKEDITWIIGGGEIYKQFIDKVDELHITHVDGEFEADTFFPEINNNIWLKSLEENVPADAKNSHDTTYTIYIKK